MKDYTANDVHRGGWWLRWETDLQKIRREAALYPQQSRTLLMTGEGTLEKEGYQYIHNPKVARGG